MPVQTGFEQRGHQAPWTSLTEEQDYFDDLLAQVPDIRREQIGQGAGGAPMYLYRVGSGTRRVLFVAQQHGSELSGRDALMSLIRDWATTADQDLQDYLDDVQILAIPTAQPDDITTRNNVNGVNLNRDHVQITQPESYAVQDVIRRYSPDLVIDLHEGANITNEVGTSPAKNPLTDPGIVGLSDEVHLAIRDAVQGAGHTWETYQGGNIHGPTFLHNAAGLRHAVGCLVETSRAYGDDTDAELRWQLMLIMIDAVLGWHRSNIERAASACQQARQDAVPEPDSIELLTGTDWPGSGPVVSPVPSGYVVTPSEALTAPTEVFGLQFRDTAEGRVMLARHRTRPLVHYLADPESGDRQQAVEGARFFGDPELEPSVPPVSLSRRPEMFFRQGGVTRRVLDSGDGRYFAPPGELTPVDPAPGNLVRNHRLEPDFGGTTTYSRGVDLDVRQFEGHRGSNAAAWRQDDDTTNDHWPLTDVLEVVPGDVIEISIWYKADETDPPTASDYVHSLSLREPDTSWWGTTLRTHQLTDADGQWRHATLAYEVPSSGVDQVRMWVRRANAEGTILYCLPSMTRTA